MKGAGTGRPRRRGLFLFIWVASLVIVWNGVFDNRMKQGIWDYVDRQQRYVAGEGPHVDLDAAMEAAIRRGLRDASAWALAVGAVVAAIGRKARED